MERSFNGVWIPRELYLHETLSWSEKILLVEITSLSNNNQCFATNEYFAKFLGLSKDRVSKMITNLHRIGLVEVLLIYKQGSKQIEKRILTPIPLGKNTDTPRQKNLYPIGKNAERGIGKNAYDNNSSFNNSINNSINNTKKESTSNSQLEGEFELLWKTYPRKMGKANALKSFLKARKQGISYETIENGLYRYVDYLKAQGTEEKFIAHGSTWFNQQKWQDEYISIVPQKKVKNFADYYQSQFGGDRNEFARNSQIIDHDTIALPESTEKFGGYQF